MAQQTINIGSAPDDGTGDTLRVGGDKINDNFTELYTDKADKAGGTFTGDIIVPDEAYDATAWNGSLEVPTKNAVRDKIESLGSGITELDDIPDVNAPSPSNGDVLTWDSTPGEWVAQALPGAGSFVLDDATDVNAPTPANGDVLTWDSTPGEWVPAAPSGSGTPSGTSFPGSPSTDDLFYRTDRHIEYYYDGTRWLSTQLLVLPVSTQQALIPASATTTFAASHPHLGQYGIYVERFSLAYFVSTTTASNYFVAQLKTNAAGSATNLGSTISTQGVTQNQWGSNSVSVNTVVASTDHVFEVSLTETGTANANLVPSFTYRLVG